MVKYGENWKESHDAIIEAISQGGGYNLGFIISKAVEFELFSSDFQAHGHDPEECDILVCWKDNWKSKPRNSKVIELRNKLEEII